MHSYFGLIGCYHTMKSHIIFINILQTILLEKKHSSFYSSIFLTFYFLFLFGNNFCTIIFFPYQIVVLIDPVLKCEPLRTFDLSKPLQNTRQLIIIYSLFCGGDSLFGGCIPVWTKVKTYLRRFWQIDCFLVLGN